MVHDDGSSVGKRLHRVADIARYNSHDTFADNAGLPIDGQLQLAFDHLIYFFLGMEVLVNGGTSHEIVVREGHV